MAPIKVKVIYHRKPERLAEHRLIEMSKRGEPSSEKDSDGRTPSSSTRDIVDPNAKPSIDLSAKGNEFQESIPQIISLLSDSKSRARKEGITKLSEGAEYWATILNLHVIPQIIVLLRDSDWLVRKASMDLLSKLSEKAEFRASIRPAIPQIIALLDDTFTEVRRATVGALLKLSGQAEFQESFRLAIPQIIALLSERRLYVRDAGVAMLSKLSQQAEFRESIGPAIPQILSLLSNGDVGIRKAGANALLLLSEHAEFQEAIVPAIPQINTLLPGINWDIDKAAAHVLANFPEQGINADTANDIVDSNVWEHSGPTTCWIAAEYALQHARSKSSAISEVFYRWKFQESEYVVQAGFDESLIKSGVGYLEQIHVFVSAEVDATSPLLSELGRIFSPFSSILFTESSSYPIPVFKDDGNVWEFDELVYFTASKFADGGSSAQMPPISISFSHTTNLAESLTGFSQGGSGGGEGGKSKKQGSGKGKERDREDDEEDKCNKDDKDPEDDPEEPSGDLGSGTIATPAEISFEIVSKIYPNQDQQNPFQTLAMQGSLTIQTMPLSPQSPDQFSKRHVQFTELTFGTVRTMDTTYKQFHVRVVVDSQQENARVKVIKPKRTPESGREEKQLSSKKSGRARGIKASLTIGPNPQGTLAGTSTWTDEVTAGTERNRYTSRITQQKLYGIVWWGFNVDDLNDQEEGIDMSDDVLPTAHFEFVGDSDVPTPPPECMDVVVASYWSMIPRSEPKSTWIQKLLHLARSSGTSQTTPYSNLCQIVAIKAVASNLPKRSDYRATVDVRPGNPSTDPDRITYSAEVKRSTADSVDVTPAVIPVSGLRNLSTLNVPMLAKLKHSDNSGQILENSGNNTKDH